MLRVMLFIKLGFRMAHDIFAGLLASQLGQQLLGDFKAFAQAVVNFVSANRGRHVIVDFHRTPFAFQAVCHGSKPPRDSLFPVC